MARGLGAMGIRGRLFVVSVVLIFLVGTVSALWLRQSLAELLEQRIEGELLRQAAAARVALEGIDLPDEIERVDPLADSLGAGGEVRVTIVRKDGKVLGDSRLTPEQLLHLEGHAGRPEVARALATGQQATEIRYSTSLRTEMMYAALPYRSARHAGVVRTAVEHAVVERELVPFTVAVAAAGLLGLGVAVFMSGLASHLASRDVQALLTRIREVLARSRPEAATDHQGDDLSILAGGVQDLADRLRIAVAEVTAERARLEALLSSMSEAVLALDSQCRITLANPAAVKVLGLTQNPGGRPLVEIARAPELIRVAREALGGAEDASAELDLPGGRTVLASARPLDEEGAGCVLVLHDMTGVRRLERIRRDFVANVSHELRTPVSIIRANAESLADGAMEDPQVAGPFLAAVQRNAERLGAIIDDLLDLSRIESGRWELQRKPLALLPVVERVVEAVADRARATGRSIEVVVDPALRVEGDAVALEHILMNLLDNAVKYTASGGHIRVVAGEVEGARPPGAVRIAVEDDGPGISERHRTRVFERFYRVDPGRSRQQGGTGLGLAIVKNLAEHMGGTVGLEPRAPTGSVFWLRLTRAP